MSNSRLETAFDLQARLRGLPPAAAEYRFAAMACGGFGKGLRARLSTAGLRDWRFDRAWPDRLVAVEIDGGVFSRGRHVRATGYLGDVLKANAAVELGWRVVTFTGDRRTDDAAWRVLEGLLRA
jgi:hypothetical protein